MIKKKLKKESVMRLAIHSIKNNYSISKLKDNQYLMQEYNWIGLIKNWTIFTKARFAYYCNGWVTWIRVNVRHLMY